ncbi:MASE1 domain-containing protein [Limisalsivibrio acetivorans]|uniref:MASE1 domain-containing protein n=1 Tax=Limisalsivibrio acetivorans TaxID=1304888 RepID=UPI0003B3DE11|nr:HD domain-containing phosphohydrolase [Limisalsivibrio acetivorans]
MKEMLETIPSKKIKRYLFRVSITGILYFASVFMSLRLSSFSDEIASVWIPAGISVGYLFIWGLKMFPGIWIGDFAASLINMDFSTATIVISTGNTAAYMTGVYVMKKILRKIKIFESPPGASVFIGTGCILPSLISSVIGVTSMLAAGIILKTMYSGVWWSWFLSNVTGTMVIAPLIIVFSRNFRRKGNDLMNKETYFILGCIVFFGWAVFWRDYSNLIILHALPFVYTPFMVWASFRLQTHGFVLVIFLSSAISILGTVNGHGPFSVYPAGTSIVLLQLFLAVIISTFLFLKAATRGMNNREEETLGIIGKAAEYNDSETGRHITRVARYSKLIAQALGTSGKFQELIYNSAPLHDVGKIGISESLILKPAKLTPEEFEEVKKHCGIGHQLLKSSDSKYLQAGAEIAYTHHEKYDGTGYPRGLHGEHIPLAGRIVAIADVFDALTSKRPYKEPWSIDNALEFIHSQRGRHFDPVLVELFLNNREEVRSICEKYRDISD